MLTDDMLSAIDEIVRKNQQNITAMGTVAERTDQTNASVVFDGSAAPFPVKVLGDVTAYSGDRVALIKVSRWWVIVGTLSFRGTKQLTVADRNTRLALTNLSAGDRVFQNDTDVQYFWNGGQWVVEAGSVVYAWVKGPGLGTNSRIITGATNEVSAHVSPTLELEGNNLFYVTSSLTCASGVAGTHFFHTFIKAGAGGTVLIQSGETPYTGTFDPIRSNIVQGAIITTGVTLTAIELTVKDQSGAAYDVYGDQDDPAYFYVIGAGMPSGSVDST